ncbi:MAG TPA: hypothetical protein VLJ57_10110, partial [Burkholderiaceae bacterium]|nr:hypothetical protein [Burkholderiaceae bacterium]
WETNTVQAQVPIAANLSLVAPPCRTTKAKRPELRAKLPKEAKNFDAVVELFADCDGDGWCDHALGVPYPHNSKMNSFSIEEIMLLGRGNRWAKALNGKKGYEFRSPVSENKQITWATFRVDLSEIKLIYHKQGGSPYVVGLYVGEGASGRSDPLRTEFIPCG